MWIIPQGRSFISHLLTLSSSITSLNQTVTLDQACMSELRFWLLLLSHWNGISLFRLPEASDHPNFFLFTDAAPSFGYGGYCGTHWFFSPWPQELIEQSATDGDSSALRELYPVVAAAVLWEIQDLGTTYGLSAHSDSTLFRYHLPALATSSMNQLTTASQDLIIDSVSPNTLSTYWTGWQCFKRFHHIQNLPFPSLDLHTLSSFLTFSSIHLSICSSTLKVYLSAINFFLILLLGSPHPFSNHHQISLLIRGIRRREPRSPNRRLPITSHILHYCLFTLRHGYAAPSIYATLESMFLLAFFGFLRCSEFTTSTTSHNPAFHPCLSDLSSLDERTLTFRIKRSKTDQLGISAPIYLFKLTSPLSPYEPITAYLSHRLTHQASPDNPLFVTESGSPATRHWFHFHLKQILSLSGFNPSFFSAHSFRIGAASTASHHGLPDHTVKILGRWTSQAYHGYIRTHASDLLAAHERLASLNV
ncbi:uncharacterized protein LOC111192746 [Astyanax mexicanus]|uniref:uncharacterized protein LOC111192746 n=1 Tax=Astyanax mexicanus TaxID=7994 RepID=UPI0020CAA10B|nr:uncharacterized protein LOC111192746 [Astyanax mexicanus]